jgi:hypothetical protein
MPWLEEWTAGLIEIPITATDIAQAQAIRADRDQEYGNIFTVHEGDVRWVGELGEIAFHRWLTAQQVTHTWITKATAGKPDFWIGHQSVDVKTVKRQADGVDPNYGAQITACQASKPIDQFFFATYIVSEQKIILLGGLPRSEYLNQARFYASGEHVHPAYQIREGHAIYNAMIGLLTLPAPWLRQITV